MTDTLKLKAAMVASGLSRPQIAKHLGISPFTLHKKLHNNSEFKASEIKMLSELLHITDPGDIFFANVVE